MSVPVDRAAHTMLSPLNSELQSLAIRSWGMKEGSPEGHLAGGEGAREPKMAPYRPIHTSWNGLMRQQQRRSRRRSLRIASRRMGGNGPWTWTSRFSKRASTGLGTSWKPIWNFRRLQL